MSEPLPIDDQPESLRGRRVAQYRTIKRLGDGGMGVVYLAEDDKLRRTVALKVIKPEVVDDDDRRKRFVREGRLAAGLTHPCIATVYEVGEADGHIFIAMEYVEGDDLAALLLANGPMSVPRALRIIREVTRGLVKAHESGVIHRDLKPENVMVGSDQIVKILDFGVAKRTHTLGDDMTDVKTKQGSLIGTPAYMSPEQAAGKPIDARSDIFSVGVLLYELLAGHRPFAGETWQETIIKVARDREVPISELRPDVSHELEQTLLRCMAKAADDRHPNARALLDDLDRLLLSVVDDRRTRASVLSSGSMGSMSRNLTVPRGASMSRTPRARNLTPRTSMDEAPSVSTLPPRARVSSGEATSSAIDEPTAAPKGNFGWMLVALLGAAVAVATWVVVAHDGESRVAPSGGRPTTAQTAADGTTNTTDAMDATANAPPERASASTSASADASASPSTSSRNAAPASMPKPTAPPLAPPSKPPSDHQSGPAPDPPPPPPTASSKPNPVLGF